MDASRTMTRDVVVIPPELNLDVAWRIMQRKQIRHLPVARGGVLVGILSDRDILTRATLGTNALLTVPAEPAALAMTSNPITCDPDAPVAELVKVMTDNKIDCLPVVGVSGRLIGLVTSTDLLLLLISHIHATRRLPFEFRLYQGEGAMEDCA